MFTTPPTVTTDLVGFMLNFNMNTDAPKIGPPPGIYTTPAMQFMAASGGSNPGLANAQGFVRLLPVASMNHCGGGPATDQFDALTSIVNWVEQGQAPASIAASANAASGFAGRT